MLKATIAAPLLTMPPASFALASQHRDFTIQEIIDLIWKSIPGAPFATTVDTVKCGDSTQTVKGIVTTMFATVPVINKAIAAGANFIIVHEPTFYNHLDETNWLADNEVYHYKKDLLNKNNIVVWRFHDGIHSHKPDGIYTGVLDALEWQQYYIPGNPRFIALPATTLGAIIDHVKSKLGIDHVKVIGKPDQLCSRINLMPGAAGGKPQIAIAEQYKPDLLICGEINEWETAEYIRDLRAMGRETALIVLGHAVSEEPGLKWLKTWLEPQVPGITITHIPSNDPFTWA